jgi:GNAT superfamily N-acetyltransferase
MRPTIRRALPADADFIAGTILAAQRGHRPRGWFDIALNRPEAESLALVRRIALAHTQSWWHVSHFWIAEADGMPAAALCAMPASGTGASARAAIEEVAGDMGLDGSELAAIFLRGAYTRSCWIQGGDGDWLIEHVASRPSHRGRGLMQALIDHALAAGTAAGYARASISFTSVTTRRSDAMPRPVSSSPKKSGIVNSRRLPARRAFAASSGRFERRPKPNFRWR